MRADLSIVRIYADDSNSSDTSIDERNLRNPYTTTDADLEKRLIKGNRGRFITQMYAGLCALLGTISFGMVIGWSSPVAYEILLRSNEKNLVEFKKAIGSNDYAWIVSVTALGCSLGTIPVYLLLERIGPRIYMIAANIVLIVLWTLLSFVSTYDVFITGRLLSGFCAISFLIYGEILLEDCTTKFYFRYMRMIFNTGILIGIVIAYIFGGVWGKRNTTILCCTICALHILMLIFAKDSPVILFGKNPVEGEKALAWYWGSTNIQLQVRQLKRQQEKRRFERASDLNKKYLLSSKVVYKGILIVLGLMFFEVFSGYYVFLFYNFSIFREFQHEHLERKSLNPIVFGMFLCLASLVNNFVHYTLPFGVKKPLLLSSILVSIGNFSTAIFIDLGQPGRVNRIYWEILTLFTLSVIFYSIGLSYYPPVLLKHLLPTQIYQTAKFCVELIHWLIIFFMVRYFFPIFCEGHVHVYLILFVVNVMGVFYIYYLVIETKDKSLVQIQLALGGNPIGGRLTN